MSKPLYTIDQRIRAVHRCLLDAGFGEAEDPRKPTEGKLISRQDFDAALVQVMPDLSTETLRRYIEAGRIRGLWVVIRNGSTRGALRILNPKRREAEMDEDDMLEA